jgi:hypothetical protein
MCTRSGPHRNCVAPNKALAQGFQRSRRRIGPFSNTEKYCSDAGQRSEAGGPNLEIAVRQAAVIASDDRLVTKVRSSCVRQRVVEKRRICRDYFVEFSLTTGADDEL